MANSSGLELPRGLPATSLDIHSAADGKSSLTDVEIQRLRADDLHAARIVVGLMSGVFAIGLLLYAFIWWVVF